MIIWNIDKSGLLSHQALWTNKWTTDRPWLDSSRSRNELRSMRAAQSGKHDCVFRLKASLVHISLILFFICVFKDHNIKPEVGSKSTNTYCTEVDFHGICSFSDNFFYFSCRHLNTNIFSIIDYFLISVIVRRLRNIKINCVKVRKSYLQRLYSSPPGFFYFLNYLLLGRFLGMRLTIFFCGVFRSNWDKSCWFYHLS